MCVCVRLTETKNSSSFIPSLYLLAYFLKSILIHIHVNHWQLGWSNVSLKRAHLMVLLICLFLSDSRHRLIDSVSCDWIFSPPSSLLTITPPPTCMCAPHKVIKWPIVLDCSMVWWSFCCFVQAVVSNIYEPGYEVVRLWGPGGVFGWSPPKISQLCDVVWCASGNCMVGIHYLDCGSIGCALLDATMAKKSSWQQRSSVCYCVLHLSTRMDQHHRFCANWCDSVTIADTVPLSDPLVLPSIELAQL